MRFCLPLALVLLVNSPAAAQKPDLTPLETTLTRIAGAARGRIGVALIHLESGATLHLRGDERFPMASVVKLPIAIEVLKQVAERTLTLNRAVWLGASDIRPCCTIERRHPKGGVSRTVSELLGNSRERQHGRRRTAEARRGPRRRRAAPACDGFSDYQCRSIGRPAAAGHGRGDQRAAARAVDG